LAGYKVYTKSSGTFSENDLTLEYKISNYFDETDTSALHCKIVLNNGQIFNASRSLKFGYADLPREHRAISRLYNTIDGTIVSNQAYVRGVPVDSYKVITRIFNPEG
jgi:hypothetical protein